MDDPRESWPLALQAVFGIEFASPDDFVEWARQASFQWVAPAQNRTED
jgi:hypothetical protein